jgi:hypothetical protein
MPDKADAALGGRASSPGLANTFMGQARDQVFLPYPGVYIVFSVEKHPWQDDVDETGTGSENNSQDQSVSRCYVGYVAEVCIEKFALLGIFNGISRYTVYHLRSVPFTFAAFIYSILINPPRTHQGI